MQSEESVPSHPSLWLRHCKRTYLHSRKTFSPEWHLLLRDVVKFYYFVATPLAPPFCTTTTRETGKLINSWCSHRDYLTAAMWWLPQSRAPINGVVLLNHIFTFSAGCIYLTYRSVDCLYWRALISLRRRKNRLKLKCIKFHIFAVFSFVTVESIDEIAICPTLKHR